MAVDTAGAATWKSSTMIADPLGSLAASLAIDAMTSAETCPSILSRSAASPPKPDSMARGASMSPAQNRTGSLSAPSHDSQAVIPGGRDAAQSASIMLLPAPADPTATVSRCPAPAVSRSRSAGLVTSVPGSNGVLNFANGNCGTREAAAW